MVLIATNTGIKLPTFFQMRIYGRTMCAFSLGGKLFAFSFMLCALNFIADCSTTTGFRNEEQECVDILPGNYKIHEIPKPAEGPLQLYFQFFISSLDNIREDDMDFELKAYVSSVWTDFRLNCSDVCPISNFICARFLWTPNVLYDDAKEARPFPEKELIFDVLPSGEVHHTMKYHFKVGCKMDFGDYPFDTQRCIFSIRLLNTKDSDIHIQWYTKRFTPVYVMNKIDPPQFYMRPPEGTTEFSESVNGFRYVLEANIILVRRLTGSIINIYAPSSLITAVSWVTFWLRLDAAPARVSLSITSLLTLCTQVQFNKSQLPPLNYITALDIWLFVCIFMVFSTLVEFAISYNTLTKTKIEQEESRPEDNQSRWSARLKRFSDWLSKSPSEEVSRIDVACRKVFPLCFFLFAVIYWVHYLRIYRREGT